MKHKHVPEVEAVLASSKREQNLAFAKFRRLGILEVNRVEVAKEDPCYDRERFSKISKDLFYCSHCLMFASRKFWFNHMKNCQKNSAKKVIPLPIGLLQVPESVNISEEFRINILSKFRSDHVGEICRKDPTIIRIGSVFFHKEKRKVGKAIEVRKSVRTDMRRIANMYVIFCQQEGTELEHGNALDMFNRSNFSNLCQSIEQYTTTADCQIKAGLKQNLFYLLKRASKVMKGYFLTNKKDDQADELDKFVSVLEMMEDFIFGDATYVLNQNRNIRLRKPSELPDERDVAKFKDHVIERMKVLVEEPFHLFDSSDFVELRDCACSRLTLLNARRGMNRSVLSSNLPIHDFCLQPQCFLSFSQFQPQSNVS